MKNKKSFISLLLCVFLSLSNMIPSSAEEIIDGETDETEETVLIVEEEPSDPEVPAEETLPEVSAEPEETAEVAEPEETAETADPENTADAEETEPAEEPVILSEEPGEETAEPAAKETEEPAEESEEEPEQEEASLFAVPEDFEVSPGDQEGKQELVDNQVPEMLASLKEGVDYAEDQLMFTADSMEYAEQTAEIFGGTVISLKNGVAVIQLEREDVTVSDAVNASIETAELPLVEPNYYITLEPNIEDGEYELYSSENDLPEVNDWDGWVNDVFDNPDPWLITPSDNNFQWHHDAIKTYAGWNATMGSSDVLVAVIDDGVDYNHEDLAGRVTMLDMTLDEPAQSSTFGTGHGTHVAGIIAASVDNGLGGAGIAPNVNILSLNVFAVGVNYAETADIISAINYAIDAGADVMNLSLGSPIFNYQYEMAVNKAYYSGITVCASAGNSGANLKNFPAAYSHTIAVAATTLNGTRAYYSNYGPWITISAPGTKIMSTCVNTDDPTDNAYYQIMSGTSMATPVVTGAVALYMSKMGHVSPDEMLKVLKKSTVKCSSPQMGAGIISIEKMFIGDKAAPEIGLFDADGNYVSDLSTPVKEGYYLEIYNADAGDNDTIIYTTNGKKPSVKNGSIVNGQIYDPEDVIELDEFEQNKSVVIQAAVMNSLGVLGAVKKVTVKTRVPAPAHLKIKTVSLNLSKVTLTCSLDTDEETDLYATTLINTAGISADLDTVAHQWLSSNPAVATVDESGHVTAVGAGTAKITLKLLDGSGKSAVCTVTVVQLAEEITIQGQDAAAPGGSAVYKAAILPSSTKNKKVTWSIISGYYYASIDAKGKLKVVSGAPEGQEIVIQAVSADGGNVIGTKTVTVCPKATAVVMMTEDSRAVYNKKGLLSSIQLFTVDIDNADMDTFAENQVKLDSLIVGNDIATVWTSSKPKVAKVDSEGNVTALSAGTTKITCKANDGSGKSASITVKVIIPMSSLNIVIGDSSIWSVGKTLKLSNKFACGNTYGKPSIPKVKWSIDQVTYEYDDAEFDVLNELGYPKDWFKLSGSSLTVSKNAEKAMDLRSGSLYVTVKAEALDGTGYTAYQDILITGTLNGMCFEDPYGSGYTMVNDYYDYTFYTYLYSEQPVNFQITSSNPNKVGAYIDYNSVEESEFWIMRNGRTKYYTGYVYTVYYFTYPNAKGTVTLTVKAMDGSNKTAKLKLKVYD